MKYLHISVTTKILNLHSHRPVKIDMNLDIFDNNPILTANEYRSIYKCHTKNSPKFPPLEVRFLATFVNMYYIKKTMAVCFFLSILMSACFVIYQQR